MLLSLLALSLASCALAASLALPNATSHCSSFARDTSILPPNATFLNSTYYPANALNVSGTLNEAAFCEVYGSIAYGGNHTLVFTVWLPDTKDYENRFLAVGNGGMAGAIDYATMMIQLNSGFGVAVAGGNAGHMASDNHNGEGAPGVYLPYLHGQSQVNAWIHDAISLFTPAAKALTRNYYKSAPRYSYYYGCSTGGAQGFALAQYHPDLFDGIYAGSPGNWYSHLALSFLWNAQHTNTSTAQLSQAELNFTTNAVLKACDRLDGVTDGLIENPLQCNFDIDSLACQNAVANATNSSVASCLMPDKIAAAKDIYGGPRRSDNGSQLYPGFSHGSEIEWALQEGDLAEAFSIPILQNLVFNDLTYNSSSFNWASDVDPVDGKAGRLIDEISPDLSAFRQYGGKLLTAQGWADPYNAATWPIEHLKQVEDFFGDDVSDFYNLFMIPGGGHCGAASYYADVPATYHTTSALIKWVERKQKPEAILSSDPPDGSNRTRKLCPWPQTARFVSGDIHDWNNYVCE